MSSAYIIMNKSQFLEWLKAYNYLAEIEFQANHNLDKAGKKTSHDVQRFVSGHVMKLDFSTAYDSQSKGVSERLIQNYGKLVVKCC